MITPYLALAIAAFSALAAALFWVSIWSNLKPRAKSARQVSSVRPDRSSDLAAAGGR